MLDLTTQRRSYDHRLRDLVRQTGDLRVAGDIGVPRSTARSWLGRQRPVVSLDVLDQKTRDLQAEVVLLRRRVSRLRALLRFVMSLLRLSGRDLERRRLDEGAKERLVRAVDRARDVSSLASLLRCLRMSPSRYHAWRRRRKECGLADRSSCPKSSPEQLTFDEVHTIGDMVTSTDYRHVPTGRLAVLAQRLGRVHASATTWYRLVRKFRWRRPRIRVHPQKPKIGLRTDRPDAAWHVDMTVIRLLDGSRAFLHAVIDNFSRRILAWRVSDRFETINTVHVLREALEGRDRTSERPLVVVDAGVENVNSKVDELVDSGVSRRVIAQTEITFSNSMIESWFRSAKHQCLFLHRLESVSTIRSIAQKYVIEHNSVVPHSAFRGQTPDEMYFGTGDHVPEEIENHRIQAREKRLAKNRAASCNACV